MHCAYCKIEFQNDIEIAKVCLFKHNKFIETPTILNEFNDINDNYYCTPRCLSLGLILQTHNDLADLGQTNAEITKVRPNKRTFNKTAPRGYSFW